MDQTEVNRRLQAACGAGLRGEVESRRKTTMERAPLSWTEDWERLERGGQGTGEVPAAPPAAVPFRVGGGAGLRIRTLGGLAIYRGEEDLAPSLMRRPSLAFLVVHLLAHAVVDPGANQYRPSIAEEQAPRLGSSEARARLRGKLRDISAFLDPDLAGLIRSDPEHVSFDLSGCSVDVMRLIALARDVRNGTSVLSRDLLDEAKAALDDAPGEFLPEWGALEKAASATGGAAEVVIEKARERAERARVDLLVAVADAYLAMRNPGAAVPYLEEANSRRPELEAVAALFIEALRASGQPGRADQVQAAYGFGDATQARESQAYR